MYILYASRLLNKDTETLPIFLKLVESFYKM